ncbi:hypothetical protein V9L05_19840 [Bernardetia sp. Wsw4-3y2]|uniref:hypothetical protein n=1 Tax=Bernardetia sp. Wsw4-3y2 TaxID=3127471 RepID=UPI0030CB5E8D
MINVVDKMPRYSVRKDKLADLVKSGINKVFDDIYNQIKTKTYKCPNPNNSTAIVTLTVLGDPMNKSSIEISIETDDTELKEFLLNHLKL